MKTVEKDQPDPWTVRIFPSNFGSGEQGFYYVRKSSLCIDWYRELIDPIDLKRFRGLKGECSLVTVEVKVT